MTTNPRDRSELRRLMEQAMHLADPDEEMNYGELTLAALRALDAENLVVVACPPGSRVVVDRAGTPCDECNGKGDIYEMGRWSHCNGPCGGRGVVEATTTYGLAEFGGQVDWHTEDGVGVWVRTFRLVAQPEETQQMKMHDRVVCPGGFFAEIVGLHETYAREPVAWVMDDHGDYFHFYANNLRAAADLPVPALPEETPQ